MAAPIPGSLITQTREPLDGKYWVATFNDLESGLVFDGLVRFTLDTQIKYIRRFGVWEVDNGTTTQPEVSIQTDPLEVTPALMDLVIALTYTDCDAPYQSSPNGSIPGMNFDAIDPADNVNKHYYCSRSTYNKAANTGGIGPAWHRVVKKSS